MPRGLLLLMGLLTVLVSAWPSDAAGVASAYASPLRESARACERRGEWDRAAAIYVRLIAEEGRSSELREALARVVRRGEQVRRLADPAYRQFAESLSLPQALDVYSEVLTRLNQLYFDRDRAEVSRLYQSGLNELTTALGGPAIPNGEAIIPLVRATALTTSPAEIAAAREAVKSLALAGKRLLGANVGLIVLECAAGTCAGLDEYTLYLHPGRDDDESNRDQQQAVAEARSLRDMAFPDRPPIGYVRIAGFERSLPLELDSALLRLQSEGVKAIVLDIRGVPGGSFPAAVQAAERWLPRGTIVTARGQHAATNRSYAAPGPAICELPLVLIVDAQTASAAEALAAALKENDRAVLVGQTTYGKAAVQQLITLETGGGVRLTLARLFGPRGQSFHHVGITPNIVENNLDRQLEVAMDQAAKMLAK